MKKWKIATPIVIIALFVAWYAFRPERLVVVVWTKRCPRSKALRQPKPLSPAPLWRFSSDRTF